MPTKAQFRLRIYRGDSIAIGPGKVALLEEIAQTGSISAAARKFDMSYRRAWLLVEEMNQSLRKPVVTTATGGARGGGSVLTPVGEEVVQRYRAIEEAARAVAEKEIKALTRLLAP